MPTWRSFGSISSTCGGGGIPGNNSKPPPNTVALQQIKQKEFTEQKLKVQNFVSMYINNQAKEKEISEIHKYIFSSDQYLPKFYSQFTQCVIFFKFR